MLIAGVGGGAGYDYMDFVVQDLWLARERHAGEMDEVCSGWEHFRPAGLQGPLETESPCKQGKPLGRQAA